MKNYRKNHHLRRKKKMKSLLKNQTIVKKEMLKVNREDWKI